MSKAAETTLQSYRNLTVRRSRPPTAAAELSTLEIMKYISVIEKQGDKILCLNVRKIDPTRIMIEGDKDSLLYLSEYIKAHALGNTCESDVPLKVNLLENELQEDEFGLFLHRLPCDEQNDF